MIPGVLYMIAFPIGLAPITKLFQTGVSQNSMFWTWMMALSLGQAMYNKKISSKFRILYYMVALIVFFVGFTGLRDWKSGWVPPLVVAGVLVGIRYPRLVVVGLPLVLMGGIYMVSQQIASEDYSWGTRVDAWKLVLQISQVSPLFGHGFANYYWYALLFPIRGWHVNYIAHSQYVDLIAQTGIVGLLCFLWIFFEVGRLSWSLIKRLPDGFALGYAYSIFAGLFGTLMAASLVDWVLPFAYNIGLDGLRASILPWILFGGLVSIDHIYRVDRNKPI
jgi:O-antigen ligase